MRPHQTFHVLEALRDLPLAPLRRKAIRLSPSDSQTVIDVYLQWLALMVDLDYLHPDTLLRDSRRLWLDLVKVDVLDLNNAMAECLQSIRLKNLRGFKALCSTISTHLYALIKDDVHQVDLGDVLAAGRLMQLFAYTSRLTLKDIDLQKQMIDDYLAIEDSLKPIERDHIIVALNEIIKGWFGSHLPAPLIPGHGPGGIAEMKRSELNTQRKYLLTADFDSRIHYCTRGIVDLPKSSTLLNSSFITRRAAVPLLRRSKTIFVPKSYKSFRTISMEPATLMYLQQGVWRLIEQQVVSNPRLRCRIDFRDQVRNRELARYGSLFRNYGTIDLSAASDSVSYDLVKQLFRGTWLYRFLICLRSTHTLLPNGVTVALKKFAPMGSALCFPIETIIFAAICQLVTQDCLSQQTYSVFGDDIIAPTDKIAEIRDLLTTLGFKVNSSKSFVDEDCWFRESCGGEYCDGVEVTPLRISRKYYATSDDGTLPEIMSLCNNAYLRGYRHLRRSLLGRLERENYKLVFSPNGLLSDNYTNYHAPCRYNPDLQIAEYRGHRIVSRAAKTEPGWLADTLAYHHWLNCTAYRGTRLMWFDPITGDAKSEPKCFSSKYDDHAFESKIGNVKTEIRLGWIPEGAEFDLSATEGNKPWVRTEIRGMV